MEFTISIVAVIVSFATFIFTAMVTYRIEQREKKQATLDALNILQEQALDYLNQYRADEIEMIARQWQTAFKVLKQFQNDNEDSEENIKAKFWNQNHEYDLIIDDYRKISGYLARIEHFALGVNTEIYDVKIVQRAMTAYIEGIYIKLGPILAMKNQGKKEGQTREYEFHNEFETLKNKIKKIKDK